MLAESLLDFIKNSPTQFHVIHNLSVKLKKAGFTKLTENQSWQLQKGGKYFVVRNGSSIISFVIPKEKPLNFQMIASHSDSPAFRIKANPVMCVDNRYLTLNTEKYGGMIMSSWFDRPLSIAGRVVINRGQRLETQLVNLDKESLIIPNLAIHMNRDINDGHKFNAQKDTIPLIGLGNGRDIFDNMLAAECGVDKSDIISTELYLYNRESGCIWGENKEFISSPKLDDLQCAFISNEAILSADNKKSICMSLIFDNEEVGSNSFQGADSDFLETVIDRIAIGLNISAEDKYKMLSNSFLISSDNAHAVHPNYAEKADPTNRPYLNEGIVIKSNSSLKYTTDGVSFAVFKKICELSSVPTQTFFNRSDMAGGSTLGNISLAHISVRSVDIGLAELSMHSSYETAGCKDTEYLYDAFKKFFEIVISCDKENVEFL